MTSLRLSPASGLGVAAALTLAASACTPTTQYRYSALIPAAHPLSWDGRTAKDGTLRLEGTLTAATLVRNMNPQIGDTAVHVPNATLEGAAFLAVVPGVELGVRYSYAAYAWSDESAQGTLPLPSQPSVSGIGPEARFMIPFDRRREWTLGIAGNFMRYTIPYAEWELSTMCTPGTTTCVADPTSGATYHIFDERSEAHYTFNIAAYPSVALGRTGEFGHVFGGLSAHTGFKNQGFTNMVSNGSTIEDAGLIFSVGAGYGIKVDLLRLSGMVTLPLTSGDSPVNYGLGGFFTAGVDLELWESREDRRREHEAQEIERERRRGGHRAQDDDDE